jgi:predicted glycoside hydrolase/deacetylase ChbG (UPF0249 family)
MRRSLILVADDAGFDSVDRGINILTQATGQPVSAEYMIEQPGAARLARQMTRNALVSIGLHFELTDVTDENRVDMSKRLKARGQTLGQQDSVQKMAKRDAPRQLLQFQEVMGKNPAHISTHGNFNTDASGTIMPLWKDMMMEIFDGKVPLSQLEVPHIRHATYTTWKEGRDALSPAEFQYELLPKNPSNIVEFVMHPAEPHEGDAPLRMLFDEKMRRRDLQGAIDVIRSGVIEAAGFDIISVAEAAARR